jgi:dGTPase
MMRKAQVFSLESNSSVRNRLTHTLEVADVGRKLARAVGSKLVESEKIQSSDCDCLVAIVENACLLHDIGNPPFGHFGEEAIRKWCHLNFPKIRNAPTTNEQRVVHADDAIPYDFQMFDGNPQGFRIATRLHNEVDDSGLNLTCATLLASVKYPHYEKPREGAKFGKKLGVFHSEAKIYQNACSKLGHKPGIRFFPVYLMELADDISYCLSDIGDSFEKGIITWRDYRAEIDELSSQLNLDTKYREMLNPNCTDNLPFSHAIAIPVTRKIISEAVDHFADNIDNYVNGTADELSKDEAVPTSKCLDVLKQFARSRIYTNLEAERIEIAGYQIINGLLDKYGTLLKIDRDKFGEITSGENKMPKGCDFEKRIWNRLSKRMRKVYSVSVTTETTDHDELIERARLIIDHVSGMTDDWARDEYQNFMGMTI